MPYDFIYQHAILRFQSLLALGFCAFVPSAYHYTDGASYPHESCARLFATVSLGARGQVRVRRVGGGEREEGRLCVG